MRYVQSAVPVAIILIGFSWHLALSRPLVAAEAAAVAQVQAANAPPVRKPTRIRWAAQYAPDGKSIAVSSGSRLAPDSGELALFDAGTGSQIAVHERELGIRALAYSRDGKLLAIGDFEGYAALLDPATLKVQTTLPRKEMPIYAVAFTPDAKVLVTGCFDGTVTLWDIEKNTEQRSFTVPGEMVTGVAVSANGRWLAISTREGLVQLRDLTSLEVRHNLEGSAVPGARVRVVEAIAFSPDGKLLLTGSWDRTLRLWNVETGQKVREYAGTESPIHSAAFSADGTLLVVGNSRGVLLVWDVERDTWKMKLDDRSYRCFGISFSPNGQQLACANWGGEAHIWDLETRSVIKELLPKNQYRDPVAAAPAPATRSEFKFVVTTQKGTPVVGALVVPKGFYMAKSSGQIPEGVFRDQKTDAAGMVRIALPATGDGPGYERMKQAFQAGVSAMDVSVEHPNFPAASCNSKSDLERITLSDPATIEIRAHRENDATLLTDLEFLVDSRWSAAFGGRTVSDGVVTLQNVDLFSDRSLKQMRVVHFPENAPPLFSDLINLPQKEEPALKYDLVLKPGVRVEGRLADQVPRPVKNGRVMASIARCTKTYVRWFMSATAEIAPDGSFVFESLPDGEMLQIVALCEGWVSTPTGLPEIERFVAEGELKSWSGAQISRTQLLPQLCHLQGQAVRPVVAMVQTARCELRVLDENGSPLPGIAVSCGPNYHYINGGSNLLGRGIDSLDREYIKLATGEKKRTKPPEVPAIPYQGVTDASGTVVISGLPTGGGAMEHRFYVSPDPSNVFAQPKETKIVTIYAGETARATVRLSMPKAQE